MGRHLQCTEIGQHSSACGAIERRAGSAKTTTVGALRDYAIFLRARRDGKVESVPNGKVRFYRENNKRVRYLSDDEELRLFDALTEVATSARNGRPPHRNAQSRAAQAPLDRCRFHKRNHHGPRTEAETPQFPDDAAICASQCGASVGGGACAGLIIRRSKVPILPHNHSPLALDPSQSARNDC